ncbi:hypothetical protein KC660_02180 [Candidatus Dojkabacteria bacterium]|uniref:Uncharacterized protein n=1 Tax=Candidatus Dojkabacteria bacterium TaxID=2099670 RepID=A0A955L3G6_9BACT|nr:hypothetical protein [Candidatus Dojkabacteria bacterium]
MDTPASAQPNPAQVSKPTPEKAQTVEKKAKPKDQQLFIKYAIAVFIFTGFIAMFSLIMSQVAANRESIATRNYNDVSNIYNGPLEQSAPNLGALDTTSTLYKEYSLTPDTAKSYVDNTNLTSTDGTANITVDFVKKGLVYQPSYKTEFSAKYILKNSSDKTSLVAFEFPFPSNTSNTEISNARMFVDGEEVMNAKSKVRTSTTGAYYEDYPSYKPPVYNSDGLKWEGDVEANGQRVIEVSYNTVGLSTFTYDGIENPKGSQDFKFNVKINGIRSYDVISGLSVDQRNFGDNNVELVWDKTDLYSSPSVSVAIGDKLNPASQVSKVYLIMVPLYIAFAAIILFLAYRFGKRLSLFDLFLITVLFILFFPFFHYLASFTIDPTMDVFSSFASVGTFSMPLFGAFAIAWLIIGGLILYLLAKLSGKRFALKYAVPVVVLFLAFFPLVVTVPEYSMLLVLFGVIALVAIVMQVKLNMQKQDQAMVS